ncbi:flippase [Marinobacter sp. AL4B]|uniref:flippase n=1 Tax=Marinobacter sp. AL4B TaxID=2871173 RepID=UPI001CAA506D|nr:flippase [Marinobacter sp. AL4B]MBZ0333204.1 flippase [Marinobacter sp. AL4B]
MLNKITLKLKGNSDKSQLLRGGIGVLSIKITSTGLGLISSIILTRALGVEQFGVYTYIFALIALLVVPAQFGMTTLIIRETAKAEASRAWGLMKGLWAWTNLASVAISAIIIIFCIAYINFAPTSSALDKNSYLLALISIPFIALSNLRGAALQGLRKIIKGQLPENIIRPLFMIAMVGAAWYYSDTDLQAFDAVLYSVIATVIAFIIGAGLLIKEKPKEVNRLQSMKYKAPEWFKSIIPLSLLEGVLIINSQTDLIMLGMFANQTEVGLYVVAFQGAALTTLGLTAVASMAMPYMARYHSQNRIDKLAYLSVLSARASMLWALPILLLFVFFGKEILLLFFGESFTDSYIILLILTGSQFLNAFFGASGRILNMAGLEKLSLKAMVLATVINLALNAILIPTYGATGAALATAISILIRNIILWAVVYKIFGIDCTAFGLLHSKSIYSNIDDKKS